MTLREQGRFEAPNHTSHYRTTAGVSIPSPFQSPASGMSVSVANCSDTSAAPEVLLLRRYHHAPLRLNTAGVSSPSPFQSPTTGISPLMPYRKSRSLAPGVLLFLRYQ